MFVDHGGFGFPGGSGSDGGDTATEQELLWCLRRLALARPLGAGRDAHVHIALQRRFGDQGLGVEHLLRCLVVGLAQRAVRAISLHRPCCVLRSDDEWRLLLALRDAGRPARVAALLAPMAGQRGGELGPVLAGLRALVGQGRTARCCTPARPRIG